MKIRLFISVTILALSVIGTSILYYHANKRNGFSRHIINPTVDAENSVDLSTATTPRQIIWLDSAQLFLATEKSELVSIFDIATHRYQQINTDDGFFSGTPVGNIHQLSDGKNLYFFKINSLAYLKSDIYDHVSNLLPMPVMSFSNCILLSDSILILRSFNSDLRDQVFSRIDLKSQLIINESAISEQVGDWGTATDGILTYDRATKSLVYVYHYSNKIIVLDDNLHLEGRGNTIDTDNTLLSTTASIQLQSSKQSIVTTDHFRPIVNRIGCANDGVIYIVSGLKADNEKNEDFRNNYVVDCYSETKIKYLGSFYLPRYRNQQDLLDIALHNNQLQALYTKSIHSYRVPSLLFPAKY